MGDMSHAATATEELRELLPVVHGIRMDAPGPGAALGTRSPVDGGCCRAVGSWLCMLARSRFAPSDGRAITPLARVLTHMCVMAARWA